MSDDLIARLRSKHCCDNGCNCDEAADRIDALEAELAAALRALTPVQPDPLGAAYVMKNIADMASLYQQQQAEANLYPDTASGWSYAMDDLVKDILAIPGPTDADLDRAALARPKVDALVEALEYIMDGYGLNPPDFRQTETDEEGETIQDDWIVKVVRAALKEVGE